MLHTLLLIFREDENIIKVAQKEFMQHVSETTIDKNTVGEPKWLPRIFKMAKTTVKRSLPLVFRGDANEVVGVLKIQLGEDAHPMEGCKCSI